MKKLLRSILTFVLILALVMLVDALFPGLFRGESPAAAPTAVPTQSAGTAGLAELPLAEPDENAETPDAPGGLSVAEDGEYDSKDELALYIHLYGHLPGNFVTKKEAEAAGWSGGALDRVMPGKCIGGSSFGNREGLLPKAKGRKWTECDVNTRGRSSRGPERIVFSNDGLIYYSPDHYESFELLYGEP